MRLQVYDSDGSIGGGNKLADTLSKAFFGDGEAAAKIALARAQINTQAAHAGYYGAQTGKTQQETETLRLQREANIRAGNTAGELGAQTVQFPKLMTTAPAPVAVEGQTPGTPAPAPVAVEMQGPVPPAQIDLYKAKQAAEREKARAVYLGGGNAQQMAEGANKLSGGQLVLHSPDPDQVRRGAILTTGNLPTKDTVTVAGDTAGINAGTAQQIAVDKVKPHWGTGPTGLPYVAEVGPDGRPIVREAPAGAVTPKTPDQASNEVVDARILEMNKFIRGGGKPTPEQADQYSQDMQNRHGTVELEKNLDTGEMVKVLKLKVPPGLYHPNEARKFVPAPAPVPGSPDAGGNASAVPPPASASAVPPPAPGVIDQERVVKPAPLTIPTTAEGIKARAYTIEMSEGLPYFGKKITPENVPQGVLQTIAAIPGDDIPRTLILSQFPDPATKQYVTAALNVIYPSLRFKSGAVINKNEVISTMMQQIPMPGDDQVGINQKLGAMAATARALAVAGFGHEKTPEYQAWANGLKARGFDLSQTFTGTAADYSDGRYIGSAPAPARPTTPGGAVGGPVPGGVGPKPGDLVMRNGKLVPFGSP